MDKYLLTITGLIIFSIIFILYLRISNKISQSTNIPSNDSPGQFPEPGSDSDIYDNVDPLPHLRPTAPISLSSNNSPENYKGFAFEG